MAMELGRFLLLLLLVMGAVLGFPIVAHAQWIDFQIQLEAEFLGTLRENPTARREAGSVSPLMARWSSSTAASRATVRRGFSSQS
jgi:hypothetical protein